MKTVTSLGANFMKFNCGPTKEERRELAEKEKALKVQRMANWNVWFAWYPVRLGKGDCRLFENVERQFSGVRVNYRGVIVYGKLSYREIPKDEPTPI